MNISDLVLKLLRKYYLLIGILFVAYPSYSSTYTTQMSRDTSIVDSSFNEKKSPKKKYRKTLKHILNAAIFASPFFAYFLFEIGIGLALVGWLFLSMVFFVILNAISGSITIYKNSKDKYGKKALFRLLATGSIYLILGIIFSIFLIQLDYSDFRFD
ncbi:MAG: hypothetical protein ACRCVT_03865 [Leadbetterella sp.]